MSLLSRIGNDRNELRLTKSRSKEPTNRKLTHMIASLTTLYADAAQVGFDDGKRESTDDEVIAVIKKTLKGLDISLSYKYDELLECEYLTLSDYLPVQLSKAALEAMTESYIVNNPDAKMGDIMSYFKKTNGGAYDNGVLSGVVKAALAK